MSALTQHGRPRPVVLIIIEGLGVATHEPGSVIAEAQLKYLPDLINRYPAFPLSASLADKITGGECGHQIIGLGRPVYNVLHIINQAITNQTFGQQLAPVVAKLTTGSLHLITLLSQTKQEASQAHLEALLTWAQTAAPQTRVYIHVLLDGRDSGPKAGKRIVSEISDQQNNQIKFASVSGRMYGLDIHNQKHRVQKTVEAIVHGAGNQAHNIEQALDNSYAKKIYDEELAPTVIIDDVGLPIGILKPHDTVIFCNTDPVAIRSLAQTLIATVSSAHFFSLVDYNVQGITALFKLPPTTSHSLGEVISQVGYRQLRLSDSEGYGLVTAALNGGQERALPLEDRRLVSSPLSDRYATTALTVNQTIAKEAINEIVQQRYDFIAITFSCLDRVAHSGDVGEMITVLKSLDTALGKIIVPIIDQQGVALLVGSHGLIEKIHIDSSLPYHQHTNNPVPCIVIGKQFAGYSLGLPEAVGGDLSTIPTVGSLIDVAPSILDLMKIPIPTEMIGHSFIKQALLP